MSAILEVGDLKKHFPIRSGVLKRTTGHVYAVDGVSFAIQEGETLGLVGESGCGKSTTGRVLLRLLPATGGTVSFDGLDVMAAPRAALQRLRREPGSGTKMKQPSASLARGQMAVDRKIVLKTG